MGAYYVNEAAFEIDDTAFEDRSVHVLVAKNDQSADVSLLVSREPYQPGESLEQHVARHMDRERRAFAGWESLFMRGGEVDKLPVIEVAVRWRGRDGLVYQRQAHIGLPSVVLLVLASGPIEEREASDAHIARALRTFRIRQE